MRLRRPEPQTLGIWNTRAPHDPTACQFCPMENVAWQRLFVVDLNRIRGLTFLFFWGEPYGIHVHRSEESCAMDTCSRFSNHNRLGIVWVYMPIAPEDRVLVLGTRKTELGSSILVSLRLSQTR